MSRNNNDLPMLPPWLSESDVTQAGYEAPVQNLPHDELIEEAPSRRRGRFKNRASEAERPEAARPDKRRKGWRRDKHEPSDEAVQQSAPRPAPGPDGPAPGPLPQDSWQQPTYEQAPPRADGEWRVPSQHTDAAPQALPTRNPSQPSPGFQPLGSRGTEAPVPNDWSAPQQAGRPDLPPPPPLPDPPRQPDDERPGPAPNREYAGPPTGEGAAERTAGPDRPPLDPPPSQWPSTGNPRLDAALSAVRPSHWPATPPPGQMSAPPIDGGPVAPPTGGGQTGAHPNPGPGNQHPAMPQTGPNQAWPTSAHPAAPTDDRSAVPPQGGHPGTPQTSADHAAWQAGSHQAVQTGEYRGAPTGTDRVAHPTGAASTSADPTVQQDRSHLVPPTGEQHATPTWTIPPVPYTAGTPVEPPVDEHSALQTGQAPTGENTGVQPHAGSTPTGDQAWQSSDPTPRPTGGSPATGADPAASQSGRPAAMPTGEGSTTSAGRAVPSTSGSPAGQSHGERSATPTTTGSHGASQAGEHAESSAGAEEAVHANDAMSPVRGQTPPTGADPLAPPADIRPVATGNQPAVSDTGSSGSVTSADQPASADLTHPTGDRSAVPPVGPATPTSQAASVSSASTGGLPTAGSDGPPPWLAAPPPGQADTSATDTPRRLPPLPDPPAPHERPHGGAPDMQTATPPHEDRRPTARDGEGPPPWLGHTAPEEAGRPGLPPTPNETAAQADRAGARTSAENSPSDAAAEPRVRADRRPASNLSPAERTETEPASAASPSATAPHTAHGGIGSVPSASESASTTGSPSSTASQGTAWQGTGPQGIAAQGTGPESTAARGTGPQGTAPEGAAAQGTAPHGTAPHGTAPHGTAAQGTAPTNEATGQPGIAANAPRPQGDLGVAASGWTSAAEVGAASARPIGGRHRLPTETSELPVAQAPVEQAQAFDQQPVTQQAPHREVGNVAPGPHAPADLATEYPGYPPQSGGGPAPVAPQQAPTDHWRDTAQHAGTAPAHSPGHPAPFAGGQAPVGEPTDHWRDTAQHAGTAPAHSPGHPAPFAGGQAPVGEPTDHWRHVAEQNPAQGSQAAPYSAPPARQQHPDPQDYGQVAQAGGQQWGNPQGYAQPPAQQPNPPARTPFQQPSLDDVPLRRAKRAPGSGWRKAVHHVSGGAINPGMSAEERRLQELVARIRQPVRGDYRIAVLSLKGGVGKTTTTMGLGSIFASIRGDRVIAVDANPDFGTLSQRVPLQTRSTVRDLLLDSSIQRYSDVRRHTSQGTSRLEVLASERDPAASEAFSDEEYRAVAGILQRFYNIILTDCGTGLMHSAMTGVLDLAHSLVLISSAAIDGARSAAATLDWLSLHGHDHLVRNAVVVINLPREGSPNVGVQQLREYFLSRCRAVHIIPYDQHLSEGAEIDLHRLHKQTKRAYVELAATVADDFATDHRRYRP
ncbi:AAA family ATPase [Nocardia gipuzkoensis]|uniref:nucleotide-binding protein n=1 Tax=Nocardia gipuzkoensis TaxID=2749991 RepID=UPI003EE26882